MFTISTISMPFSRCAVLVVFAGHLVASFKPFGDVESLKPRRLHQYNSKHLGNGLWRYSHAVEEPLMDGSQGRISLKWELDAHPDRILSLDTEGDAGTKIVTCPEGEHGNMLLQIHRGLREHLQPGRYIVGSRFVQDCVEEDGGHLYRRILAIDSLEPLSDAKEASDGLWSARIRTEEVGVGHVAKRIHFEIRAVPPQVPEAQVDNSSAGERRLFDLNRLIPQVESHTSGGLGKTYNILSTTPKQSTNFGWNWDLVLRENNNFPRFNHSFPGGKGYLLLLNPHISVHAGIFMNFTSVFPDLRHAPHVRFQVGLDGRAELGGRAVALLRFDDSVSGDPLNRFEIPLLTELSKTLWGSEIAFAVGNVPVQFSPGIKFNSRAYHIGKFKGSIQMGVHANAYVRPLLRYDTIVGADAMMDAEISDLRVIPPTWSVFADHFEMGLILEPQLFVRGIIGKDGKNMTAGFGVKPYMNVSITRDSNSVQGAGSTSDSKRLIIYPYRASGLGDSGLFSVGVGAGGGLRESSLQLNQGGVMEFHDRVQRFDFGEVSKEALISQPIIVSVSRQNQPMPLAEVQVRCTQIVGSRCAESPLKAKLLIGSEEVTVELALEWADQPLPWFVARVRGVSLEFPKIEMSPSFASEIKGTQEPLTLEIVRAGRIYKDRVVKDPSSGMYNADSTLEFGLSFLPSWHDWPGPAPMMRLMMGTQVIARGLLPEIPWQQAQQHGLGMGSFHGVDGASGGLDIDVSLHAADGVTTAANLKMRATVDDPSRSSFFLFPFEASSVPLGVSKAVVWTARGAEAGGVTFNLDALVLADNGILQEVPGTSASVIEQCTEKASPDAAAAGYANLGTYCFLFSFGKNKFALGQKVLLRLRWTLFGKTHEMLSTPVMMSIASEALYSVLRPHNHEEFSPDAPERALRVAWAKRVDHAAEDVRAAEEEEPGIAKEIEALYSVGGTSGTIHGQKPAEADTNPVGSEMLTVSVVPLGSESPVYHKEGILATSLWLEIPRSTMASWASGDYEVRLTWREKGSLRSPELGVDVPEQKAVTVIHVASSSKEDSPPSATRALESADETALSWTSNNIDWNHKMQAFNPNCDKHPLKYAFGAGVFVKGMVKNIRLPHDMPVIGGVRAGSTFDTGYKAITNIKVGDDVSGVLSENLCKIGACEGILPGCPPPKVDATNVPHVSFVFNRPMHWHKGSYKVLREFIAYMLATMPEAITMIAKNHSKDAGNVYSIERRLTGTSDSDWGKYWTNGVSFQAAVPFQIDIALVQALLDNGALAIESLDDGFVGEQGPLAIAKFGVNGVFPENDLPRIGESEDIGSSLANGPALLIALLVATLSASFMAYGLTSLKKCVLGKRTFKQSRYHLRTQDDAERCHLHDPYADGVDAAEESE